MTISNDQIAEFFYQMAELLELQGGNPFRARAYRRAAIMISNYPESIAGLLARGGDLSELPALGRDLAGKVREICLTGGLKALQTLEASADPGMVGLAHVPGLGPKRIALLRDRLGIGSVEDLARAASQGRIRQLPGFGASFEARLMKALGQGSVTPDSSRRSQAMH